MVRNGLNVRNVYVPGNVRSVLMKKENKLLFVLLIIIIIFLSAIIIGIVAFKLNSWHYRSVAQNRIDQVIEMQEANIYDAKVTFNDYDYFENGYVMEVYYDDDFDIRYRYIYERERDNVYVTASLNNATLDLTDRKGKYDYFITVYFDEDGKISEVTKR